MILLVTGGRKYTDYNLFSAAMEKLDPSIIIQGGATGADALAIEYGKLKGIHYATVPALWDYYNNPAGPKRNSAMLLLRPDYCLAMPGHNGTRDMISKCEQYAIPVWRPYG